MLKSLLPIFLALLANPCQAQPLFPGIDNKDFPGAVISAPRIFNGQALFGYMDGGAELYLEYGFIGASITEIIIGENSYKVEVFKMKSPEDAFGIYSVSRFNCKNSLEISGFSCQTKYQLQVCRGPFYLSIIGRKGDRTDSLHLLEIGKAFTTRIKDPDFDITPYFPESSVPIQQLEYFLVKGRLGIVNGQPDLEDYFAGINGYTAVIMNGKERRIISVKFNSQESMNSFAGLHKWDLEQIGRELQAEPDGALVRILAQNHLYIEIKS